MKKPLKVFFAGKLQPSSKYAPPFWREEMVWQLNLKVANWTVQDTCLVEPRNNFLIEQNLPIATLFGQSCFYIQSSDVLVVNLTDDISVGGSQEIFIAKQFNIPVIGVAPRGGKFNRLKYELGDNTYWNWVHPFVGTLCDVIVDNVDELALALDDLENLPNSGMRVVDDAIAHYMRSAAALDTTINNLLSFRRISNSKYKLRVYFAGKMGQADGFSVKAWRDELAAVISKNSRFSINNLDFLEVSHEVVNENDPRLIFGRDAYLIRTSDIVIVNLSDDISVGGSVEMLLAKYFHRPLIGIARPNGKFVNSEKELFGRKVTGYVNPFVSATCDWLVHDTSQLPGVVNELYGGNVKTNRIVSESANWYKRYLLPRDRAAQHAFELV
jgi:hypothetical protein